MGKFFGTKEFNDLGLKKRPLSQMISKLYAASFMEFKDLDFTTIDTRFI